ncbi:MAG: ABC transporter permease [Hyphomicrobiales bacterium]|nr:ABC transporter permease [Hyphomicrobiales bacterium]MDE2114394.1 ABC transporter permease [Hyphomicrobiales bacterium]
MSNASPDTLTGPAAALNTHRSGTRAMLARNAEAFVIPAAAVMVGLGAFSAFLMALNKSPLAFFRAIYFGGFGSAFSIDNSLTHASPLLLTALCVALPARLGLVIIGGEGALVLGGLAAASIALPLHGLPYFVVLLMMGIAGALVGGIWIGIVGALRYFRGVNETIASLLMAYIGIAVMNQLIEGPLRDPASLNKPSTYPIGDAYRIGDIPGMQVHWGLVAGLVACVLSWALIERTTWGFAARVSGSNIRAAQIQGLPVGKLILAFTFIAGAFAGLAGMIEVAAVQGDANASLASGYGYTGILVAFLARQNPLAIIPVAFMLGAIDASGSLLQRHMGLPDATVQVLQGILFVTILFSDTLYGRIKWLNPDLWTRAQS